MAQRYAGRKAALKWIEDRKQSLIDDLLRRAAAIRAFDDKRRSPVMRRRKAIELAELDAGY